MDRSGVIIIEATQIALIERIRAGRTYYLFPGGGIEAGEAPEEAALREAREELGVTVELGPLVAIVRFGEQRQYYYLARISAGVFGGGDGQEMRSPPTAESGSYRPVWLPRASLAAYDVRPRPLAELILRGGQLIRNGGSALLLVE